MADRFINHHDKWLEGHREVEELMDILRYRVRRHGPGRHEEPSEPERVATRQSMREIMSKIGMYLDWMDGKAPDPYPMHRLYDAEGAGHVYQKQEAAA